MHGKQIVFMDLDRNPVEREFFFHLSLLEIIKMDLREEDGLRGLLKRIENTTSRLEAYNYFEGILLESLGRKHEDNIQFVKNQSVRDFFIQSNALEVLILEFLEDPESAGHFMEQVIPPKAIALAEQENAGKRENQEAPVLKSVPQRPPTADYQRKKPQAPKLDDSIQVVTTEEPSKADALKQQIAALQAELLAEPTE